MNDTLRDEMLKPRKVTVDGMDTRRAAKIVTLKIDDGNEELIQFFAPEEALELANMLVLYKRLETEKSEDEVIQYYTKDGEPRGYKVVRPDGSVKAAGSFGKYDHYLTIGPTAKGMSNSSD